MYFIAIVDLSVGLSYSSMNLSNTGVSLVFFIFLFKKLWPILNPQYLEKKGRKKEG